MKLHPVKKLLTGLLFCGIAITFSINVIRCLSAPEPVKEIIIPYVEGESVVAIVQSDKEQTKEITYDEILSMVRDAVTLTGGFVTLIENGDTVVLKPNLVQTNDFTLGGWSGRSCSFPCSSTRSISSWIVQMI